MKTRFKIIIMKNGIRFEDYDETYSGRIVLLCKEETEVDFDCCFFIAHPQGLLQRNIRLSKPLKQVEMKRVTAAELFAQLNWTISENHALTAVSRKNLSEIYQLRHDLLLERSVRAVTDVPKVILLRNSNSTPTK